jgi:ribosomal protein S18 acetylase RimI-like enzyme
VNQHADTAEQLIRTAVATDLPELQRVYAAASLSNEGDAPLLLARPEFLVFAGDGIVEGRTRVAVTGTPGDDRVLGFATVVVEEDGQLDLEDLFVDPQCRRRGIARRLILDAVRTAREAGHQRLSVTGNPHALAFYRAVGFVEIGQVETALAPAPRLQLDLDQAP